MIKEKIIIPKLLYEGTPDILAYEIYRICYNNSKGFLIADTNYGEQDITLATILAGARKASEMLYDGYINKWNKPNHMMTMLTNKQFEFLKDDIEISIEMKSND